MYAHILLDVFTQVDSKYICQDFWMNVLESSKSYSTVELIMKVEFLAPKYHAKTSLMFSLWYLGMIG